MPRKTVAAKPGPPDAPPTMWRPDSPWVVSAALVLLAFVAYGPLCTEESQFLSFDDQTYIATNDHVIGGLTAANVRWAFTTYHARNWHPLIWLSLQLDADLFGNSPRGFHFTNVLLHAANAVVIFLLMRRTTRTVWPGAFAAALFALHPLHVESVAWITERKDVLSTLLWLLTMYAYAWYAERPGWPRYLVVAAVFAVGLTAKQMLVTLPVILLLFDYWPLRRVGATPWRRLVLEKLPLLALAAAVSRITMQAQLEGYVPVVVVHPLPLRVLNAAWAAGAYLRKTVWPSDLAPMYTRPFDQFPLGLAIAAAVLLLAITAVVLGRARRWPAAAVGWLWFLVALGPVVGIVQIGMQTMADRYTYVPHIGLFIGLAFGPLDWLARRWPRPATVGGAAAILGACLLLTRNQALLWRTDLELWTHAVRVTRDNFGAHDNLGTSLLEAGRLEEAAEQFRACIRIEPKYPVGHAHLGQVFLQQGRWAEAAVSFRTTTELFPVYDRAFRELGRCYLALGDAEAALAPLAEVARRKPNSAAAHYNLATALMYRGRYDEAAAAATEALRLKPDTTEAPDLLGKGPAAATSDAQRRNAVVAAHDILGTVLAAAGKPAEAEAQFRAARDAAAGADPYAEYYLGWCLSAQGRADEARSQYQEAKRRFPDWPRLVRAEAWPLATHPDPRRRNGSLALLRGQMLCEATENRDAAGLDLLAAAHAELGRFDEAARVGRRAAARARETGAAELVAKIEERVRGYEKGQPARE